MSNIIFIDCKITQPKREYSRFPGHHIGDEHPVFIVFEAGATHTGLESAMRLATIAKEAGADAVKFQMVDPERLLSDKSQTFTYKDASGEETSEPLYDILKRRILNRREWSDLKHHCDSLELAFFCTALFDEDVDFLVALDCPSIKICSGDVNHFPLIRKVAQSGVCVQLDTGSATLGEIEQAVDVILAEGNENIIIHHCPTGYPATLERINLNIITTLKKIFPLPIGFSDHTPKCDMDIAAVALGVNLIEKTITEDKYAKGPEHMFSLLPAEAEVFVNRIRDVEKAMGKHRRHITEEEKEKRKAIRRGWHDGEWRRPENHINPPMIDSGEYKIVEVK